ncbi:IclR family transcriptional regulator [Paenibacillus naphthalenovorans]|uniref:IclR family transcriptional regulator n=2 Tax=Paenibacillus TaxID=44249 RepID=UPI0010B05C56|nr:IclR family transcriptional regulator [Paenibacillus naphthalenovorans]GCL74302.1 IclR family transcriptional regulator [Paenibacillus naphthalenovorans]
MRPHQGGKRFSSVQNAVRLLNAFSPEEAELGISELSEKLGIAKSTVHRLVTTLSGEGFIAKDPNTNLYRLGISILAISNIVTSTMPLHQTALPVIRQLGKKTKESIHIGIFRDGEVIFLNRIDGINTHASLSMIGSRVPAHCTSSGQVFLAYQPKETVNLLFSKGLKAYTRKTVTDVKQMHALLDKVREQGFSVSVEELHEGIASVAAPIRNSRGQVIATVSIPGPVQRISKDALPLLTKLVLQAAKEISLRFQQLKPP